MHEHDGRPLFLGVAFVVESEQFQNPTVGSQNIVGLYFIVMSIFNELTECSVLLDFEFLTKRCLYPVSNLSARFGPPKTVEPGAGCEFCFLKVLDSLREWTQGS